VEELSLQAGSDGWGYQAGDVEVCDFIEKFEIPCPEQDDWLPPSKLELMLAMRG
jgi:hypothetical protein